ncbi:hypothetical protein FB459_2037 [Yimella lutea]|uniref:MazG-like nucleotide pyrophosphohydrolase family protein n=1 Tax=Yimella lutea TaxID=587872 RepID=A0A542EGV3_9MICO|nr:hypothetical protein [Yimella lutea]TQJ14570.1 hypothetical protein FB459_2037 [Yimella lutea]
MNLNEYAEKIHANAADKGFWDSDRNMGEMLMLAVSELAEALEEHRAGRPAVWYASTEAGDDRSVDEVTVMADGRALYGDEQWHETMKPEGVAVEIADCLIRCLDMLNSLDVDIDSVVRQKMAYNASREQLHGKSY